MTEHCPAVTCLCPTYGRFGRLREAVACFLLQDYPRKHLVILNDAPSPIVEPDEALPDNITLVNAEPRFHTLGHKRQTLLELAQTPLAAHWDDDDLYMPWHLSQCAEALRHRREPLMVRPRGAWWALGCGASFLVRGPCHNVFEGQVVFSRVDALAMGGYPPKVSGQAKALIEAFQQAGDFREFDPWPFISYVYRWGDGIRHVSTGGDNPQTHAAFGAENTDYGGGESLIPPGIPPYAWARAAVAPLFARLLEGLKTHVNRANKRLSTSDYEAIERRLKEVLR